MKARWTQSCVRGLRIGAENRDKCVLGADPKKSDCDKDRMRDLRATTEALERGTSDAKGRFCQRRCAMETLSETRGQNMLCELVGSKLGLRKVTGIIKGTCCIGSMSI